jgi:hypothetical protein
VYELSGGGDDVAVQNDTRIVGSKFPIRVYIGRGARVNEADLDVEKERENK